MAAVAAIKPEGNSLSARFLTNRKGCGIRKEQQQIWDEMIRQMQLWFKPWAKKNKTFLPINELPEISTYKPRDIKLITWDWEQITSDSLIGKDSRYSLFYTCIIWHVEISFLPTVSDCCYSENICQWTWAHDETEWKGSYMLTQRNESLICVSVLWKTYIYIVLIKLFSSMAAALFILPKTIQKIEV